MKMMQWLLLVLGGATLLVVGCKKAADTAATDAVQVNGVAVDMPKFHMAFAETTNSELRKMVFDVDQSFRYRDYVRALMALEQLSSSPDLTEPQKKIIGDVTEQLKKVAGAAPPAAPAQ